MLIDDSKFAQLYSQLRESIIEVVTNNDNLFLFEDGPIYGYVLDALTEEICEYYLYAIRYVDGYLEFLMIPQTKTYKVSYTLEDALTDTDNWYSETDLLLRPTLDEINCYFN